jgi:hypothetical protein
MRIDRAIGPWLILASSLLAGGPALAQRAGEPRPLPSVPDTELQPPAPAGGPFVKVPPDAMLVAEVKPAADGGMDERTFRSYWSFDHVLSFYDHDFQQRGVKVLSRRARVGGVIYQIRKPDGQTATVVVQDTKPTLIETRERW